MACRLRLLCGLALVPPCCVQAVLDTPDLAPNVQLYPCGGEHFQGAQRWSHSNLTGTLRLQDAPSELSFVAAQSPPPAGVPNAVLATEALGLRLLWDDGKLKAPSLGQCLLSDQAGSHGYLPNVFLGDCKSADKWVASLNGSIHTTAGNGQCLDVGSGGSGVGKFFLPLLPAALPVKQALNLSGMASWGGSVIQADNGTYHMFASVFKDGAGLSKWTTKSEILHAVAEIPEGPFQPREIVAGPFAHNPQVVRANDGTYLMFMIGGPLLLASESLDGPWEKVPHSPSCNNPAPVTIPGNDTVYLFCHGGPHPNHWGISVELTYATTWRGPWTTFRGNAADLYDDGTALFAHPVEDPTVWVSSDGTWHMLMHAFRMGMLDLQERRLGGYAFSHKGPFGPWTYQENKAAYTGEIEFEDGTQWTVERRERPKLLLDKDGRPTHLYNGVCPPGNKEAGPMDPAGHCFTMVQRVNPDVPLWNHAPLSFASSAPTVLI